MIRGVILNFSVLMCVGTLIAQRSDTVVGTDSLETEFKVIEKASFGRTQWSLAIQYRDKNYRPSPPEEVAADIKAWLEQVDLSARPRYLNIERELLRRCRPEAEKLVTSMTLVGSNLASYVYLRGLEVPLRFARRDTLTSLVLIGVSIDKVYNTLQLDGRGRATTVIQEVIMPSLRWFAESFQSPDVARFGMCVLYGSKNFADRSSSRNLQPEMVALTVPARTCRDFVSGMITEDELIDSSDVYVSDRDMTSGTVKKIRVALK
jgi:hypothetical protein